MSKQKETPPAEGGPKRSGYRLDSELQTMARIDRLLSGMPDDAVRRIFSWLESRYRRAFRSAGEGMLPTPNEEVDLKGDFH